MELWTEKYRSKSLKEYVFRDKGQKRQCENWVKEGALPHLLFSGLQGTGKTTLAKALLKELEVHPGDILQINASQDNSVDVIREKIVNFVQTIPWGDFKYVLLDEADYLTPNAQAILRGVMEQYAMQSRFILTCNYPNRIIPAIHSRCQGFHTDKLDREAFFLRVIEILEGEGVDLATDDFAEVLDTYVRSTYPDLRKCINTLQMNVSDGRLLPPCEAEVSVDDYRLKMVDLFKAGKILDARKLIVSQIKPDEYEDTFKFLYQNLEFWGDDDSKQNEAIVVIRDGICKHVTSPDPEINLSATLVLLNKIREGRT